MQAGHLLTFDTELATGQCWPGLGSYQLVINVGSVVSQIQCIPRNKIQCQFNSSIFIYPRQNNTKWVNRSISIACRWRASFCFVSWSTLYLIKGWYWTILRQIVSNSCDCAPCDIFDLINLVFNLSRIHVAICHFQSYKSTNPLLRSVINNVSLRRTAMHGISQNL